MATHRPPMSYGDDFEYDDRKGVVDGLVSDIEASNSDRVARPTTLASRATPAGPGAGSVNVRTVRTVPVTTGFTVGAHAQAL